MTLIEAIKERHSVRQYLDRPIEQEKLDELEKMISEINEEAGLHLQLVTDEPEAFDTSRTARYGTFSGVKNYITLVGPKEKCLQEKLGYWGEKIVLQAQIMGLNTCWVGLTYRKILGVYEVDDDEKLMGVITIGYGENQGEKRKTRLPSHLSKTDVDEPPRWFRRGVECAMLAPTATNQQKFLLTLEGDKVTAKAGKGFYTKMDLGIVKYHFEIGAGLENFTWND